ncbi:MAG: hypothetical protein AB1Z98_00720 [Nannocystaceae bacterium]
MQCSSTAPFARLARRLGMAGLLSVPLGGCAIDSECTELGCDNEAVVTFPLGVISGSYSLVLRGDAQMATARCLDTGPDAADNPEGLTCDAQGFTLVGHPLANEREIVVTVIPDEGDGFEAAVRLEAVDQLEPNGPDCPPTCFVRNGQVRLGGP